MRLNQILWVFAIVVSSTISFACGGAITAVVIGRNAKAENFEYERDETLKIVQSDPAFSGVEINEASRGGIWVSGKLKTSDDYNRFASLIRLTFGKKHSGRILSGLSVPKDTSVEPESE